MSKGEQTRQAILGEAAQVFSISGYAGTSMDALTRATGLTKGGIYNHFGSKEALALEAFDFARQLIQERFNEIIQDRHHPIDRLMAVVLVFRSIIYDPLLQGGCPVLNTATEADDTNPALRERAQQASSQWRTFITQTVKQGIEEQQLQPETKPDMVATVLIATLEGAIMLSKLYGDLIYMDQAVEHLSCYVQSLGNESGSQRGSLNR
ncbi:TetR family transcriptional regulator [Reticulibacter mediterranei]|uniref:TetR family transcriptional regulator n=1 Tax=Reticulibacter mediterranei TaxID=2778369 RepID=A0A8J3IR73_9CHLR|nr:TetR/AcrR family transcriptional regulator [Reticulibacter mediterranei]GHO99266.1 TetR family transcriptional regulator [Reticulibacter mediterranei]